MRLSRRLEHDHRPRRVDRRPFDDARAPIARFSFVVDDGEVDVALVPNLGDVYLARLPAEVAKVVMPAIESAARAVLPLVAEDHADLGPLRGLKWW